jgi:hypothetical protein
LRLDLLPGEASASLLSNPIRNGLLLACIAAALTGQSLTAVAQPVRDIPTARYNLLRAVAHLGMIGVEFAAGAAAVAAEADREDALQAGSPDQLGHAAAAAAGGGASSPTFRSRCCTHSRSRSRSRSRGRRQHSRSRSPNRRPDNSSSTDQLALAIMPDRNVSSAAVSKLHVRDGPLAIIDAAAAAAAAQHACASPRARRQRRLQQQQQGSPETWPDWRQQRAGSPTLGPGDLLQTICCDCFSAAAAGSCDERSCSCSCCCWGCSMLPGGTVLEHAMFQLLEAVLAGDAGAMWGLLYSLQQRCPAPGPTAARSRSSKAAGSLQRQKAAAAPHAAVSSQALVVSAPAAAAAEAMPGGAGFAGFGCGSSLLTVRPLVGPSWRCFKLPYSAHDLSW